MKLAERIFRRNDYYITSPFGYRINPITGEKGEFHDGVDYGTNAQKWPQYALEKGIILNCGIDTNYANAKFVWVQYDRLGIKLLHYHLDSISVVKGQEVDENTILGYTGKTGYATGIHLHLGMKYLSDNKYVDAELYDYQSAIVIVPTKRNKKVHQIEVIYDKLNARDNANGNKLGTFVPLGFYNVLNESIVDGQKWVEINKGVWCAMLDDCCVDYPTDEDIDYKQLYLEAQSKLERIRKILDE